MLAKQKTPLGLYKHARLLKMSARRSARPNSAKLSSPQAELSRAPSWARSIVGSRIVGSRIVGSRIVDSRRVRKDGGGEFMESEDWQ